MTIVEEPLSKTVKFEILRFMLWRVEALFSFEKKLLFINLQIWFQVRKRICNENNPKYNSQDPWALEKQLRNRSARWKTKDLALLSNALSQLDYQPNTIIHVSIVQKITEIATFRCNRMVRLVPLPYLLRMQYRLTKALPPMHRPEPFMNLTRFFISTPNLRTIMDDHFVHLADMSRFTRAKRFRDPTL